MEEQAAVGRINAGSEATSTGLRLALFEPDRPHNLGMALRLGACLGVPLDVVEPCGFPLDDRRIKQGSLDYADHVAWRRHASLRDFLSFRAGDGQRRLVLLSTRGDLPYHRAVYRGDDVLMLGRESAGVPDSVHEFADLRVRVPLRPGLRSLNVATAAAVVLGEELRQAGGLDLLAAEPVGEGER